MHAELSCNIKSRTDGVYDAVRMRTFQMTDTGQTLVELLERSTDGIDLIPLRSAFVVEMNKSALIEVSGANPVHRFVAWLTATERGTVPLEIWKRRSLKMETRRSIAGSLAFQMKWLLARTACWTLVFSVLILSTLRAMELGVVLAMAVGTSVGLYLHELGHAMAFRLRTCDVVFSGFRVGLIVHERSDRLKTGAFWGPLLPGLVGLLLVWLAWMASVGSLCVVGIILAVHLLGLLCVAHDGRIICID